MGTQQKVLLPLARPAGSQPETIDQRAGGSASVHPGRRPRQGTQPEIEGRTALDELRAELAALRAARGGPSTRTLARQLSVTATNLSHNTVNLTLRCDRPPQWINLKAVVRILGGDVDQFHRLWSATQSEPIDGAGRHPSDRNPSHRNPSDRHPSGRFRRRSAGLARAVVAGAMDPNGVRHLYCGLGDGQLHELWFAPDLGQQLLPCTDTGSIVAVAGLCRPDGDQMVAWATEDGLCNVTRFGPTTPVSTVTVEEFRTGVSAIDCALDLAGDLVLCVGTTDGGVHVATPNRGDGIEDGEPRQSGHWSIRSVGRYPTPILSLASQVDRAGGLHIFFSTEDGLLRQTRVRGTTTKTRVRAVSPTAIEAVACGADDQEVTHVYWGNRDGNLYQTWLKRDETGTRRVARFSAPVVAIAAGLSGRRDGTHLAFSATDDGRIRSTRFGFGIPPHDRDLVTSPGAVTSLHAQQLGLDSWDLAWGTEAGQVHQAKLNAGEVAASVLLERSE